MTDETRGPVADDATPAQGASTGRGGTGAAASRAAGQAPRRPAMPLAGWVFGGALGAFFAALALLAFQVRAGQDPALGPAQPVAQAQKHKLRRVLIRRVIKRVVIHHPPTGSSPASPAAVQTSAPPPTTSPPPPSPAPAPAPEPAPLTTQSS